MTSTSISVSHGQLEAIVDTPDGPVSGCAVICHPHPQHGGTMHNKVVYYASKALVDMNVAVLRFNFRGVGQSTGKFDEGIGEREDTKAAVRHVEKLYPDSPLILGGFSFGSMVACSLIDKRPQIRSIVGVGLPLRLYDFSFLSEIEIPALIIQGENDPFGRADEIGRSFDESQKNLTIHIVKEADHFLSEQHDQLRSYIQTFFSSGAGSEILSNEVPPIDPDPQ